MAFERDHGQCCLCLPLKFGVGLITMYILITGFWSVVSLFSSQASGQVGSPSVALQSGGYNLFFAHLPSSIGVLGLGFGFFGILGVYDDKPQWVRIFLYYFYVRMGVNVFCFLADLYTLYWCKGFAEKSTADANMALWELSHDGLCFDGRIAYIIGFAARTIVDLYMLYYVWKYVTTLELNPPYPIDFGFEKYDTASRWLQYKVLPPEEIPVWVKKEAEYESTEDSREDAARKKRYDQDGQKGNPTYGPDGMPGPAYIRAFRPPAH